MSIKITKSTTSNVSNKKNGREHAERPFSKLCFAFIALILAVFSLFSSCEATQTKSNAELVIVSTVFPSFDFARQIAGELYENGKIDISILVPPGSESHSYEPSPADMIKIQNCDLFLYTGGESDAWVDTLLKSLDSEINKLAMTDSVELFEEEPVNNGETGASEHHHDGETEYDGHVWTSPKNAIKISASICDKLCAASPENADYFQSRLTSYTKELDGLDMSFKSLADSESKRIIIFGDRFPMRYFAEEYDITYFAAFPGCDSNSEPSASTIAFLTNTVKNENIKTVFYIEFSNHRVADSICEATGAKAALFHSCHNVSKDELASGATYVSLMRTNFNVLRAAWSES